MRLNLVNTPLLVGAGLATVACERFNSRFGSVVSLNDNLFKYVIPGPPKEVFLLERISLSELFQDIPQSIVGLVPRDWTVGTSGQVVELLETDLVTAEAPVLDDEMVVVQSDPLGALFALWAEFSGITNLIRREVELSSADGYLYIDATKFSTLYTGLVSVKYE